MDIARLTWRAEGLRWVAAMLTHAADALDSRESPAELRPPPSAGEACDENRSRGSYRVPYY